MARHFLGRFAAAVATIGLAAAAAYATETVIHTYDARGRLVKVEHSGTVNDGLKTEYKHDKADNRTNVTVTGSAIWGTPGNDNPLNGTAGDDTVYALAGNDVIYLDRGGNDIVYGGDGVDIFFFGAAFGALDQANGEAGYDGLFLRGNYTIDFRDPAYAGRVQNFENITLSSFSDVRYGSGGTEFDYYIIFDDAMLAAGLTFTINGAAGLLQSHETMSFDGSDETNGNFRLFAGAADDVLIAGAGNDLFYGGLGADRMSGGAGGDTFRIDTAAQSSGAAYDTVVGFDHQVDRIDLTVAVTSFGSTVASGQLSSASFDTDMAAAMQPLAAGQARLFTPDQGGLAGRIFLIVDMNAAAGYQSGADLVVEMEAPAAPIAQSTSIFI